MGIKLRQKPNICCLAVRLWASIKPFASSTRTRLGLLLFVLNFPFGYGALFVTSAIAASAKEPRWLIVGTCCYALSWIMLGLAILFFGSNTVAFLQTTGRRKWKAWRMARKKWHPNK